MSTTALVLHIAGAVLVGVWLYLSIRVKKKPTYYGGQNKGMGKL